METFSLVSFDIPVHSNIPKKRERERERERERAQLGPIKKFKKF